MQRDEQGGRIVREGDGSSTGCYGPFVLKTALQPIFGRLDSGQVLVCGLEALLRLFRDGRSYPPARFFARIGRQQRLSLEALCRSLHLANASLEESPDLLLFLNVNPALTTSRLSVLAEIDNLVEAVAASRFRSDRIVCEITEDSATRPELLTLLTESLRAKAFRIAVDDFGTASSDSGRVSLIRPDIVKLDGDWTKRLMDTKPGYALLRDSVKRFQEQGIAVVIEGLENHRQVELGWGTGAEFLQGFGLARPQVAPTAFSGSAPDLGSGHN